MPTSPSLRRRFGSFAVAIALLALQLTPVVAAEITTDLWVYQTGDTVTVTGVDYAPDETVEIVTTDPNAVEVDRGQAQTDLYGGFTYAFVLTSDVAGIYDVVGTGLASGLTASTQFDPPNLQGVGNASTVEGSVAGGSHGVNVTVDMSGNNNPPLLTLYARTVNGSAVGSALCSGGGDFEVIPAGSIGAHDSTDFPIGVTICENSTAELDETFTLEVSTTSGFSPANTVKAGIVTITNDDTTAAIADVSQAEGNAANTMVFNVTLSSAVPAGGTVTIDWATASNASASGTNGNCPAGSDYRNSAGTVTILAGGSSGTASVPICGDTAVEGNETFLVNLTTNSTGNTTVSLSVSQAIGTIQNDDAAANSPPNAVDDSPTVLEDSLNNVINVLGNDTDPDVGDILSVTAVGSATNGTTSLLAGVVRYTPNANYCGPDSFTYDISDGHGGTDTATVNVTVTCVNDAPTANDDSPTVLEDSLNNVINVLGNDTDPDVGDILSVTAVGSATNGTTSLLAGVVRYTPNANYCGPDSFTYDISDGHGGTDTATVNVTVTCVNDAPTANDDSPTVLEDSLNNVINVLGNDTDPDVGDILSVTAVGSATNGTTSLLAGVVRYTPNANYCGPDSFTYDISDGHGGTDTATVNVTVTCVNDAPSVAINTGPTTVNEGSTQRTYTFTVTDLDIGDDFTVVGDPSCGDNGSYVPLTLSTNLTGGSFKCVFPDGDATSTLSVTVNDGDVDSLPGTLPVQVDNVEPTIAISGNSNVNEGSPYSLTLGLITDPGTDTVTEWTVHWGDGSSDTYTSGGVKTHTYADGPNNYAITVDLRDEDSAPGYFLDQANALSVQVDNVEPTIAISGNSNVNEGSPYSLTLGLITDPGTDTVTEWTVHWGDGSSDTYTSGGVKTHTYADGPNNYAITVDLRDEDSAPGYFLDQANALSVQVDNVEPTIAISGNSNVNEGSPYSLTLGLITDPGTDTVTEWTVHWGDGSSDTYTSGGVKTHTYADGPNNYAITVDLRDEDSAPGDFLDQANALSVQVDNVEPSVGPLVWASTTVDCQTSSSLTVSFSDPGTADTPWAVDISWGDGTTHTTFTASAQGGQAAKTHVYVLPGTYTATVEVTDKDGGIGTATVSVTIAQTYTVQFLQPLDGSTVFSLIQNNMKAGRVVPIKAVITDDCTHLKVTNTTGRPVEIKVVDKGTSNILTIDTVESYSDAGQSSSGTNAFRWTGDSSQPGGGFWIYNLDSNAYVLGVGKTGLKVNNCYRVDVWVAGILATDDEWAFLKPVK